MCTCLCVYAICVCVCVCLCVCVCARVERARMYVCLSVTLFYPFLKQSTNALRACLHVHMSVYVECFFSGVRLKFLFFREVKRFCFEDAHECVRVSVYVFVCVCVCNMCVCVCMQYVCVCVLVYARE